jgi:hypothetical protein
MFADSTKCEAKEAESEAIVLTSSYFVLVPPMYNNFCRGRKHKNSRLCRQDMDPDAASIKILSETSLNEFPKQDRSVEYNECQIFRN